jgi:hypothetical protein
MRRTTLLLLLATTATCYGQSNADIPADRPLSESNHIDEDQPRPEQSNEQTEPNEQGNEEIGSIKKRSEETGSIEQSRQEIGRVEQGDEETRWAEEGSEETQRVEQNNAEIQHFYRIRQDEEMETLRRQQQPQNTFNAPIQRKIGRQYKQKERLSVSSKGHAEKSKPLGHTTPAPHKPSNDSSKKSSNQQSGGSAHAVSSPGSTSTKQR